MTDDTVEIDWNAQQVNDVRVRPRGEPRTVVRVVPGAGGGHNWVTYDDGATEVEGQDRVTIKARPSS